MADYHFVQDPPESYLCQVCLKVLQEPHATECCGQHYCKACLENWFIKNGGNKTCPHCRAKNFNHMLYKPLQRKIGELEIYCTYRPSGCQATMQLSNHGNHLSGLGGDACQYVLLLCTNNCGTSVRRMDWDKHLSSECKLRLVECTFCKSAVQFVTHRTHISLCNQRPVPCPRFCEAAKLRYCDLKGHEGNCPNMPVRCDFYAAGCKQEFLRKDYADHMAKSTTAHLAAVYSSLNAKCAHLKKENEALKQENKQLQSQMAVLKTDFEALKRNAGLGPSVSSVPPDFWDDWRPRLH